MTKTIIALFGLVPQAVHGQLTIAATTADRHQKMVSSALPAIKTETLLCR